MKLSKLYSNNKKFKDIIFNEGFNIIYGDVEKGSDVDPKTGEHNIGKTSLVHLIDFLLLKTVNKKNFFGKHSEKLSGWVFYLEIKLNSGKYLTISRAVDSNTKISFKEHFSKNQDFRNSVDWDYSDLSINAKGERNPKEIFEKKYLQFNVNTEFPFRSFLSYLLRTQNDYQDVFKLNKFRGKDLDWKPVLFHLLGFNSSLLQEKYELGNELTDDLKYLNKLKNKQESESENTIKLAIEAKEREKKELQKLIDNFDFYQKEQSINYELVKKVENSVSSLNKKEYALNYDIDKIKESLDSENKPTLKVEEIKKIFEEIKIFFPNNLSKSYQEVLNFCTELTKERDKYLKDEFVDLSSQLESVQEELKKFNTKRIELMSVLKEKDTFVKYKKYQDDINRIESEIFLYQKKLEGVKTIENFEDSITEAKDRINKLSILIKEEINKDNQNYQEIRKLFQEIYKKTFEYTALLIVEPNSAGNADFTTSVLNKSQDLTGKADGYTSTKVLCVSFVLSILIHYSTKSFFRFAYHDGILESWGNSHKTAFIELIRNYCKTYNLQYILSLIKSDVPPNLKLLDDEKVKILKKGNELFGFEF